MTAVLVLLYNLIKGTISVEVVTNASGMVSLMIALTSSSLPLLACEWRKEIATAFTFSSFIFSAISLICCLLMPASTSPVLKVLSDTGSLSSLGTSAGGEMYLLSNKCFLLLTPLLICRMSLKPSVVSSAVLAPLPDKTAFVVTVVPCTIRSVFSSSSQRLIFKRSANPFRPLTTPIEGSFTVVELLFICCFLLPDSINNKSVNVPPTSIPITCPIIFTP